MRFDRHCVIDMNLFLFAMSSLILGKCYVIIESEYVNIGCESIFLRFS